MKQYRVLTVGDGDLSFSLALKRAYPQHISLTATTLLPNPQDLYKTYANSKAIVQELEGVWNQVVLYGVDATHLMETLSSHTTATTTKPYKSCLSLEFDRILFCHPHLGDSMLYESESNHAQRHYVLLCHYLSSARSVLASGGKVHVCLCGTQPQSWDLEQAVRRSGFLSTFDEQDEELTMTKSEEMEDSRHSMLRGISTACPTHTWLFDHPFNISPQDIQPHYPAPRKYRNGKLGSKAFLGKYGYRHRRTRGDLFQGTDSDMRVEQSVNFLFQVKDPDTNLVQTVHGSKETESGTTHVCSICNVAFETEDALNRHMESPALPDVMLENERLDMNIETATTPVKVGQDADTDSQEFVPTKDISHSQKGEKINLDLPTDLSTINDLDETLLYQMTICDQDVVGKRLKWFCRQQKYSDLPNHLSSKKQCLDAIREGRLYINRTVALDSSRVLKMGDVITLMKKKEGQSSDTYSLSKTLSNNQISPNDDNSIVSGCTISPKTFPGARILKTFSRLDVNAGTIIVAYKPVGMRSIGTFSSQTLESVVSEMRKKTTNTEETHLSSLTKLDTGCAGLCVLVEKHIHRQICSTLRKEEEKFDVKINYDFYALVHGCVPRNWDQEVFIKLPEVPLRRWKRCRIEEDKNDKSYHTLPWDIDDSLFEESANFEVKSSPGSQGQWLAVKCVSSVKEELNMPALSTLVITSGHESGRLSNVICFILRKVGFPVVNDRFCKREFSLLPRRMRNIIKKKLSIGCYSLTIGSLSIDDDIISMSIPDRIKCEYWKKLLVVEKEHYH